MTIRNGVGVLAAWALMGCGGSTSSTTEQTPTPTTGTPAAQTAELTISASGIDNKNLTVAPGTRLTFINNDTRAHELSSDPHPTHTECPELNNPVLNPGGQFSVTLGTEAKTCGMHDHLYPGEAGLRGSITISATAQTSSAATGQPNVEP